MSDIVTAPPGIFMDDGNKPVAHGYGLNTATGTDLHKGLKCYIAAWENDGSQAQDVTENELDGTLTSGAIWTPGDRGPAIAFDGANDNHLEFPTAGGFDFQNITMACRIRQDDTTVAARILCPPAGNSLFTGLLVGVAGGTQLILYDRDTPGTGGSTLVDITFSVGDWLTVVQRASGAGVSDVDINGVRSTLSAGFGLGITAGNFRIGNRQNNASDWEGLLDWFAVWDRQLSDEEMLRVYTDQGALITPPSNVAILVAGLGAAGISLTPDPVTVPILIPAPTLTVDRLITPDPVAVPVVIPTPTLTFVLTPDPIAVPIVIPAPTVVTGIGLAPDPVAVPVAIPTPTLTFGLTPDPVTVPVVVPAPTLTFTLTPDPVTVPIVTPAPTLTFSLTPDPVAVPVLIPVPTLTFVLNPDAVLVPIIIPAPTVNIGTSLSEDAFAWGDVASASFGSAGSRVSLTDDTADSADTMRATSEIFDAVVTNGYAAGLGNTETASTFDAAAFFEMLRIGGTLAEAFMVAVSTVDFTSMAIGWPGIGVGFELGGYNLYRAATREGLFDDDAIAFQRPGETSFAVAHADDVDWFYALTAVSSAGVENLLEIRTLLQSVASGVLGGPQPNPLVWASAMAIAAGQIQLSFEYDDAGAPVVATGLQVARATGPNGEGVNWGVLIQTVVITGRAHKSVTLDPTFADGETVFLAVRAVSAAGDGGELLEPSGSPIVADATGPAANPILVGSQG